MHDEAERGLTGWTGTDCSMPICVQGYYDPACDEPEFAPGREGCYRCANGGVCVAPDQVRNINKIVHRLLLNHSFINFGLFRLQTVPLCRRMERIRLPQSCVQSRGNFASSEAAHDQ